MMSDITILTSRKLNTVDKNLIKSVEDPAECYLPSLNKYANPFAQAGFEILEKDNFCWIPHSAGPALVYLCRVLSPVLNLAARKYAMRSLIVSRKPIEG
ncbi:MAG: hypothetical protein KAI50_06855 [Desulfobacterales bacterium]|nr:hypothetical protein [Desulfobacterales bacterium]